MREDATDSARSRMRASASRFDQRGRLDVQTRDRHLRVHDVGRHVAVERDAATRQGSGTYAS